MLHRNFFEPPEDALPPAEVRLTELRAEPYPDGRRVRLHIALTPFQQRPNMELAVTGPDGVEAAHTHIVEVFEERMVITIHLRGAQPPASFTLNALVSYPEAGLVDQRQVTFETHESPAEPEDD